MNPSKKIKLLKEISSRLAIEEWSIIDLTLRQFGCPTQESWGNDKHGYIVTMIENESDEIIKGIARHLELLDVSGGIKELDNRCWKPN